MTGEDICKNALEYTKGGYVYWYGGKGQKCTATLLKQLSSMYQNIYTKSYIAKCEQDIKNGKRCIDCSGLVCKAYGIKDIGTYQMATDTRFHIYEGTPCNGMILWKWTHCGIYYNGKVIEARGKDYGVISSRTYKATDWQRIYTVDGVDYMQTNTKKTATEYLQAAIDVLAGKFGNGTERTVKLKTAGYNSDIVQELVNYAIKGAK